MYKALGSVRGAAIFLVEGGKTKRWSDYFDFDTFRKQAAGKAA